MKPELLIAFPISSLVIERARKEFSLVTEPAQLLSTLQIVELAQQKKPHALLVSTAHKINDDVIARLPDSIKIIATYSVGFDHLNIQAGLARGIVMTNTPDVLSNATADLAMLLMLGACRRIRDYMKVMEAGWGQAMGLNEMLGLDVSGKTLAILGMGRIGRAVAQRARGFGMRILYSNRKRLSPDLEQGAEYYADFRKMLPHAQILSLHAPATAETNGIINRETLALLPKQAVFVNVARGSLVNEKDLLESLNSGHLFAAGLDVFNNEPHFNKHFLDHPQVLLAPHMGSATVETRAAMGFRALDNIQAVLQGRTPPDALRVS